MNKRNKIIDAIQHLASFAMTIPGYDVHNPQTKKAWDTFIDALAGGDGKSDAGTKPVEKNDCRSTDAQQIAKAMPTPTGDTLLVFDEYCNVTTSARNSYVCPFLAGGDYCRNYGTELAKTPYRFAPIRCGACKDPKIGHPGGLRLVGVK